MDISIYDNYSGIDRGFDFFPVDGKYKTCDSMLAIICVRGSAVFRVRLHDFPLRRCMALVIGKDTPFYILEKSLDFHIDVVRAGESVFDLETDNMFKINMSRLIFDRPLNYLNERKTRMFHIIHSYLKVLMKERDDRYRDLVVYEYLKIFFYEACHIIDEAIENSPIATRDRETTNKFFRLAEKNFAEHRKVEYYAREIGITPKHLAAVVKHTTDKYPSQWLEDYALLEAKTRLTNSDESIQVISIDLNFATPSHFTSFFKSRTGMTPTEFRNTKFAAE